MNFEPSPEQRLLVETVSRFVTERYAPARRERYAAEAEGFSRSNWQVLADLGLLGLCAPADHDGFGGQPADTMLVMRALGEAALLEPYWPVAILTTALLGDDAAVAPVARGERLCVPALAEPSARHDLDDVSTRVDDGRVHGVKSLVPAAASADEFLVSAIDAGPDDAPPGPGATALVRIDARGTGVTVRSYRLQDGSPAGDVVLDGAPVLARVVTPEGAAARIARAADLTIAALCAEAAGAIARLIALTAEHLATREQFGRPLAKFQVLQHRLVDMRIALEEADAMAFGAARDASHADPAVRARTVSAAKSRVGRAARFVTEQAIQLHGGMGMTREHAVSHFAKRLVVFEMTLGDTDFHAARFADLMSTG